MKQKNKTNAKLEDVKNRQLSNLPVYQNKKLFNIFFILKALNKVLKKYKTFSATFWGMPTVDNYYNTELMKFKKTQEYPRKEITTDELQQRLGEIFIYLQPHIRLVGEEQTIKDLQLGLNILKQNYTCDIQEGYNYLQQDGVLGNKTYGYLCELCQNYPPDVIKKYIKKGIQSNIIFDTKNKSNIDTLKMLNEICANIERGI